MFCCFVVTHVSRELNHSNISQDSHRKRSQIARVHASTRKRSRQGLLPIPFTHGFTEKINHHEIKYSIRLSIKHEIIPYLNQTEIKYQTWDIHHQKSNPWDDFSGTFFGGNHDFPYHYGLCPVNFPLPIDWVTWVLSPVEKGGTGDWAVFSRPWTTKQSQKSWKRFGTNSWSSSFNTFNSCLQKRKFSELKAASTFFSSNTFMPSIPSTSIPSFHLFFAMSQQVEGSFNKFKLKPGQWSPRWPSPVVHGSQGIESVESTKSNI